ncbi:lasso peptide biosynthesis B2 protein [Thermomonospora umbrina]|uniref:Transglutaminase superfamily protein n=1 Tax=Thermomonospora umbrina TaxID=111806 RepID=A0A3D9SV87_9ACTN|nr:lasso peptide biosynthesis B2 protein [Thermomonospora umbrina]REE96915.1 transglutaminase superfamily protein [Thermomonospora umbrina]
MTMPVTLEPSASVPFRRRMLARVAVCAALPLARMSPGRLRRVLTAVRRGARPATEAEALAAREAIVTVSVRCAGQGCLPRSVASALLCRLYGRWPDWCTGIRTEPFRAHAWIEVDGRPIGELGDIAYFHKVMTVRAEP